jgi:hypothetical protein
MIDNPILKRRDDESLKDYEIRICSNKEKYDLSWDQVADVLNHQRGEKWSESKYRKWYSAFRDGLEYAKNQNMESDEVLNELELKKIELLEERKKLQVVRGEYNKIARDKSRKDLLFEYVSQKIEEVGHLPSPTFQPLETNDGKKAGVLGFGDEHFGKEFVSENNEYNEKIYLERMNKLLTDTVNVIKKEKLDELTVLNGADSVEGMALRVSQLTALQYGFIDQVIKYARYKVEWLKELSKHVKVRYIHIQSANHTELRVHGTSRGEMPKEDVERIIAVYIHDMLKDNERIDVPMYDDGIVDFEVLNYSMVAAHGHQIKSKKNAIRDLSMLKRKFFDFMYVSHFHHGNTLTVGEGLSHNIEVLQLPSIMGSDEYSDTFFSGAKAGASFDIYEEGKGRTISYNFILN